MKLNLTTVILGMVGGVLIYSAVTDRSPVDVLKMGIQGKEAPKKNTPAPSTGHDVPVTDSGPAIRQTPHTVVT